MKAPKPGRKKGLKVTRCTCGQRVTGKRGAHVACGGCGTVVVLGGRRRRRKKVAQPVLLPYQRAS